MREFIRSWRKDDYESPVKQLLMSYRSKVAEYNACKDLFETMYPSAVSQLQEVSYRQEGVNSSENAMFNLLDHRDRCLVDLRRKRLAIEEIDLAVACLDADEHAVILRYYMTMPRRRIEDIAELLHMSESSCWRAHRRGLHKLVEKLTLPDSEMR